MSRIFLVDVENTGSTPHSGVMTEFGVVDFKTRDWFHGVLHDSVPSAENPAIPALCEGPGPRYASGDLASPVRTVTPTAVDAVADVFIRFEEWIRGFEGDRRVFASDNNGHDFMFFAFHCDQSGVSNPFGHSSRRIGDLAAGLSQNWRQTSAWKRYRKTRHDHHPVNDSMGNAEALETVLRRAGQKF